MLDMKALGVPLFALGILALVVWALSRGFGASYDATTIAEGVQSFDELADRFELVAQEKGGVYAFNLLREARLPPNIDMHLLGHRIGDEMYKQEGIEGIALCTDEFRNACSHTMVIGALTDHGEAALPMIRDACKRAPGGPGAYTMCYHGLGHGVFAYYGYSIPETVAMCEKTGTEEYRNREATECIGGAVMELSGGGGHDRELWLDARAAYIEEDPVAFCLSDEMPDFAKSQCLTYITPELWAQVGIDMGEPDPRQYVDAFALCAPIRNQELRTTCYGAFGKEFVPLAANRDIRLVDKLPDEKYQDVILWCGYANVAEGIDACLSQAVFSLFWGGENDPEASFRFCALVTDPGRATACYRTLGDNIRYYIRDDRRSALCGRLPSYAQEACATEQS